MRTKSSPTTVGTIRKEMEAKGDLSKLDRRTDSRGHQRPAHKPPPKTTDPHVAEIADRAEATGERRRRLQETISKNQVEPIEPAVDSECEHATPPSDPPLSLSAQHRLDAAIRAHKRKLDLEFDDRV